MNGEREACKSIGNKLKDLRISSGYSSYEQFAIEHDLSRMQYWRIEKGLTNLTIRSLMKLLNIHKITLEDFFQDLHAKSDGKAQRTEKKSHKQDGRSQKLDVKALKLVKALASDGDGQSKKKK